MSPKNQTVLELIALAITAQSDNEYASYSDSSTPYSFEDIAPTNAFEHLIMTELDHTEKNDFY